jgi:hypothetical protein
MYSTLPVHPVPIVYIGGVCCTCTVRHPTGVLARCVPLLSFIRFGTIFLRGTHGALPFPPSRSTLALAADPRLRSALALAWVGTRTDTRATIRRSRGPERWDMTPVCACTQLFSPHRKMWLRKILSRHEVLHRYVSSTYSRQG